MKQLGMQTGVAGAAEAAGSSVLRRYVPGILNPTLDSLGQQLQGRCRLPSTFLGVTIISNQQSSRTICTLRGWKILLTFPTGSAEGQGGVQLIFNLDQSIQHHRATSRREKGVSEPA